MTQYCYLMAAVLVVGVQLPVVHGQAKMERTINRLTISSDGALIAFSTDDGRLTVRDVKARRAIFGVTLEGQSGSRCKALTFFDRNQALISVDWLVQDAGAPSGTARVSLWTLAGERQRSIVLAGAAGAIAVSQSRQLAAVAVSNNAAGDEIHVFDARAHATLRVLRSLHFVISNIDFSPDGSMLLAFGDDRLSTWTVSDGQQLQSREVKDVRYCAFTQDNLHIVAFGDRTGAVRYLDARTGREFKELDWERRWRDLAMSGDHSCVATCGQLGGGVALWETSTLKRKSKLGHDHDYSYVSVSFDGKHIAGVRTGSTAANGIDVWTHDE